MIVVPEYLRTNCMRVYNLAHRLSASMLLNGVTSGADEICYTDRPCICPGVASC